MQKTSFFPPFIRTLSVLFIGTLLALVLARGAMLGILWPEVAGNPASDILNALYIGTKFDIRMVVLGLIPIALILGIPPLERLLVRSRGFRGLIDLLYAAVFAAATLVYIIDFGWFFYMHTRVDASLFELLGDPDIAGTMVWESYPVVWITFGLIVVTALYALFFGKTLARHEATPRLGWKGRTGWSVATFAILFLLGYGQISSNLFPLRWSNAFFSVDKNISILALNPIQNLFDTVNAAQGTRPNIEATRESYPRVAAWLRVPNPDPQKLNFMRTAHGTPAERQEKPLNVVVIIMESMTWPRTSFSPNLTGIPEDTTPNLMALSKDSLYYPLFFAPTRTTARAIFTTMTGIPDVNRSGGTSSRNQALVDQALMMNEFKGYSKYYMIGGSASWANIRGFLSHNIEGLHLLEEGSWKAPNTDVWGLSDLDLFREAAAALTKSPKPFVAVIQTAGFHRPYTIPEDNAGFQIKQPSEAILKNYGFTGADEYNSLRFSDHSLGEFFKIARQQPWFDNTVFAIFGDHGLNDTSLNMSPGYLAGPYVRDKDAIIGSMLICEMAAYYRSIGSSIKERLEEIYKEYGRYLNKVDSFEFPGLTGMEKMASIMQKLRDEPLTELAGHKVVKVTDYKKPEETGLPAANVLIYSLDNGATVVVRPSGTEPKIKTYFTTLGKDLAEAQAQKDALAAAIEPILA